MIKLELTVREAMNLATNCNLDIYERIVNAFEVALGVNQHRTVTITGGMTTDNRIASIKAIRLATGWGLKESKDWSDELMGAYDYNMCRYINGKGRNSVTLNTPEAAEKLLRDLVGLGCEGFLS
jgi:hypothetical protein